MLCREQRENIRRGVEKYELIMKIYQQRKTDVSKDNNFQRLYTGFYKIRRGEDWRSYYYQMLEGLKDKSRDFKDILAELKERGGRLEASFASKMFHTRNPGSPIIDRWILTYLRRQHPEPLGWRLPYSYEKNKVEKIVGLYDRITKWYKDCLRKKEGKGYIKLFNEICPNSTITNTKKIDFILWQLGRKT